MATSFEALLEEVGKELHTPLHIDEHRSCLIACPGKIQVQLQLHPDDDNLLLAAYTLAEMPPGKYGEKVLKAALQANHSCPRIGTFALSQKKNSLVLYEALWLDTLDGPKLSQRLHELAKKVKLWKEAIASGILPTQQETTTTKPPPFPL